eukprot:2734953-Amphidinium_carterae.1
MLPMRLQHHPALARGAWLSAASKCSTAAPARAAKKPCIGPLSPSHLLRLEQTNGVHQSHEASCKQIAITSLL